MIRNLHANSWFAYGSLDTAIVVRVGGRQGCKFGATIFNCAYAVGLGMLHAELLQANLVLRTQRCGKSMWEAPAADGDQENIIDATFVDDECVLLTAASPVLLDKGIDKLLCALTRVFRLLRLEINWKPGKTECFLQYRGHGSSRRLDARRVGPKKEVLVVVPGTDAAITVVDCYKHLGGVISRNMSHIPDARNKSKAALSAFVPLAIRIFGSNKVDLAQKTLFMWALVLSRLRFLAPCCFGRLPLGEASP